MKRCKPNLFIWFGLADHSFIIHITFLEHDSQMLARNYSTVLWNLVSVLNYKHPSKLNYSGGVPSQNTNSLITLASYSTPYFSGNIYHFISIKLKNRWVAVCIWDHKFVAGVCLTLLVRNYVWLLETEIRNNHCLHKLVVDFFVFVLWKNI